MQMRKKLILILAGAEVLLAVAAILYIWSFPKIRIRFTASSAGRFEVFYADRFNFTGRKLVAASFLSGKNELSIPFPKSAKFDSIRLDPATKADIDFKISKLSYCPNPFKETRISPEDLSTCRSFGMERQPGSGRHFVFRTTDEDPQIMIDLTKLKKGSFRITPAMTFIALLAVLAAAAMILVVKKEDRLSALRQALVLGARRIVSRHPWLLSRGFLYMLWLFLFLVCVCVGFTFSSLGVVRAGCDIVLEGERKVLGNYRAVRSDEYMAHGLLPAVEQFNSTPKFPTINRNKGLSGRNYLVLHDTGAPVRHIAIIGRPATWGYFLFDLRRGMSWHNLFPVFFAVFAFWFLLDTLLPANGKWNFLFALSAVFVSTSAMWSFWPAYNCAGTFLAVAALVRLVRSTGWRGALCWGGLTGWAAGVSALTVYFPRIWGGVVLAAFMFLGWSFENRREFVGITIKKICGLILGLALFGFMLSAWYQGVKDLIPIILASVYPGKRFCCGGEHPFCTVLLGWFAPSFLGQIPGNCFLCNDCEAQSPMLVATIFILFLFRIRPLKKQLTFIGVSLFIGIVYLFTYAGFPRWLAGITFFSKCPPSRLYYSVSLAMILLMAILFSHKKTEPPKFPSLFSFATAVATVVPLLWLFFAPPSVLGLLKARGNLFVGACILGVYLFVSSAIVVRPRPAIAVYVFACIASGIFFNPLCIAPQRLKMELLDRARAESDRWRNEGRTLFLGNFLEPNLYAAIGGKSFNGHFIPEDMKIFDLLFKDLPDPARFHRQNHLYMMCAPKTAPLFRAYIPEYQGAIYVEFNSARYDFSKLPIDYVVASEPKWIESLKENGSLRFLGMCNSRARFRVLHPAR